MSDDQRQIPQNMQPHPADYSFDLESVLRGVVFLRCVGQDHSAEPDEHNAHRTGSGVVIEAGDSKQRLILTMAYLVVEAEAIWITTHSGQVTQGHVIAVDHQSGFALIRPSGKLACPSIPFGDPAAVPLDSMAILAAAGGISHALETRIVARQEFVGYWEYYIEDALLATPAHPVWGGGALIGTDGTLLGIAAVILQQGDIGAGQLDINLIVPVSHLQPVMAELLRTGSRASTRAWLGILAADQDTGIIINDVTPQGPAERAGLRQGDRITAIDGREPGDLGMLWRLLWSSGTPPVAVTLTVIRDGQTLHIPVHTIDRSDFDKAALLH